MTDQAPAPVPASTMRISIGATSLNVDLEALNGIEWRAARAAGGYASQRAILAALDEREFDAVAAVFWIWARRDDEAIGYAEVLAGCSYATLAVS